MKKIKLTESDLLMIVNKVLNEQEDRQFNEDEINILHFIFERELKPPFREGEIDSAGDYKYFNRDGEHIGWLDSRGYFGIRESFSSNIKYKVCSVFEFPYDTWDWFAIRLYLKSWVENQINVKLFQIYL